MLSLLLLLLFVVVVVVAVVVVAVVVVAVVVVVGGIQPVFPNPNFRTSPGHSNTNATNTNTHNYYNHYQYQRRCCRRAWASDFTADVCNTYLSIRIYIYIYIYIYTHIAQFPLRAFAHTRDAPTCPFARVAILY